MSIASALARGRESFERQAWEDAHAQLRAEDAERALGADDLMLLAASAQMIGADADAASAWARAHTAYLEQDTATFAALCDASDSRRRVCGSETPRVVLRCSTRSWPRSPQARCRHSSWARFTAPCSRRAPRCAICEDACD